MLTESETKQCELNILLELKRICSENRLRLYLCEGTLLGAIRHKGFIPWDDDIDVCLPRPDYNSLVELSENGCFPGNMKLISPETNNYKRPFMKIIDTDTYVQNEYDYLMDANAESIWVDVFPVDGLPDDYKASKKIYDRIFFLRKCLMWSRTKHVEKTNVVKSFAKLLLISICKMVGADRWNRLIINMVKMNDFDSSNYVGIVAYGSYGIRERMKKADFLDICEVEFEGYSFNATASWHNYLKQLYGDYMMLPPEEKRGGHSITAYRRV